MDAFIESLKEIIVNERYGNILNDELLLPLTLVGTRSEIDGPGIHLAAVFKPNLRVDITGRIKKREVFKSPGNKSFQLNQLVIESGRVFLELADGDFLGFFAASQGGKTEENDQCAESNLVSSHALYFL